MWLTNFSIVLAATSFFLSVLTALSVVRVARAATELQDRLNSLPNSPSASLAKRVNELEDEVLNLANRVKMIKVRRAADHVRDDAPRDGMPDPHKDPDGWRKAMNLRIAQGRIGGVSTN